jgi:hypothetical protein
MSYYCEFCNYTAKNSSNFTNHKKTQKHRLLAECSPTKSIIVYEKCSPNVATCSPNVADAATVDAVYICEFCNIQFKHHSSYYRHRKKCQSLDNGQMNELKIKLEFEKKEKEIYQKMEKEKSELLKDFMANANVLLNKANDNTKITAQAMQTVSVSALKYANDKFNNAPALLPLENFNINDLSFDNEEDKKQLTEILIYNAKQKSLDKLLGDHIVKCYKKENPEEQCFHTTDSSRLNYIVRDLIQNAIFWSVDKNGIKICSSIIKPLIEKCIGILMEYQKELLTEMGMGNYNKQLEVQLIIEVLMSIDKGGLESDINKYIAPYFNLDKL